MLTLYLSILASEEDKHLFEAIYLSYRKQMMTLALSILHNESDAEDVVHNVFLNIAQKHMNTITKIASDTDLRNYLLKATKNTTLNMLQKKKKENTSLNTIAEYPLDNTDDVSDDTFLDFMCNKLDEFMFKTGSYSSRAGVSYSQRVSVNQYPKVVYYQKYHFARVLSWNTDGTPRSTQSKWGNAEVVNTYGYDVYTDSTYGSPIYFYK